MAGEVVRWPLGVVKEQNEGPRRDSAGEPVMAVAKAGR